MEKQNSTYSGYFTLITFVSGFIVFVCGLIAMTGWLTDSTLLTTFHLGDIRMRPNGTLCFIATGISMMLFLWNSGVSRQLIRLLSLFVFIIGSVSLMEYVTGSDFKFDGMLLGLRDSSSEIRISVMISVVMIVLGVTMLLLTFKSKKTKLISDFNLALILSAGFFDFICFALDLTYPAGYFGFSTSSAITSMLLIFTAVGLFHYTMKDSSMRLNSENQILLGLTVAGTLVTLVTIHSIERSSFQRDVQDKVEQTIMTQHYLNELMASVLDVQTAVRGYLLSGNEKYLKPAFDAKDRIPSLLKTIDSLINEFKYDSSRVEKLHAFVDARISFADRMIETQKKLGSDSADKLFDSGTGKALTDSIRNIVYSLDTEEHKLLYLKDAEELQMSNKSKRLIIFNFFIELILLLAILRVAMRAIRTRNNSLHEIRKLNEGLETKVKERTSELALSEKKYKYLFESNPIPMWIFDENTLAFIEVNKAAISHYGYSEEEFYKMTLKDLIPEKEVPVMENIFEEKGGNEVNQTLGYHKKKCGDIIFVEIIANPVDINGRAARLLMANDITIKKVAEDEIRNLNESLEQKVAERTRQLEIANKAKSEFLTNMSHEIRTPMNAILGYAELLESVVKEKLQINYLESIKTSGRALMELINDILDLSKIEADKLELEYEYINATRFFSEFKKVFSLKISEKGLSFKIDVSQDIQGFLFVDEARLRQIVLNLLGNAVKFTQKGEISMRVYPENSHTDIINGKEKRLFDMVIEVADTGIGIPEESQKVIFDSFVQVKNKLNQGGTGLGLAITKRLVKLMRGDIRIESEPEKGSTFIVSIPGVEFLQNFETEVAGIKINPGEIIFEKAVILIVDDIESNRRYISDILRETRVTVIESDNGMDALELIEKTLPNLVISDIRMPGLNGFELLEKIKSNEKTKHIPVIAYSASVMKEQKETILKSDFTGLLMKPLHIEDLYLELMKCLKYSVLQVAEPVREPGGKPISEITDLTGLITDLEGGFHVTWKNFEVRQPLGEIRDFGRKLIVLGKEHSSEMVTAYGEELVGATDSFNIDGILRLIKRYPEMIETLKSINRII